MMRKREIQRGKLSPGWRVWAPGFAASVPRAGVRPVRPQQQVGGLRGKPTGSRNRRRVVVVARDEVALLYGEAKPVPLATPPPPPLSRMVLLLSGIDRTFTLFAAADRAVAPRLRSERLIASVTVASAGVGVVALWRMLRRP